VFYKYIVQCTTGRYFAFAYAVYPGLKYVSEYNFLTRKKFYCL